jgi:hypothetical protein
MTIIKHSQFELTIRLTLSARQISRIFWKNDGTLEAAQRIVANVVRK